MISPNILAVISKTDGIGWTIVEKDYFLTLLLDSISSTQILHDSLVFKGGTALRKVYFSTYRYSEDLDFTLKREFGSDEIKSLFEDALAYLKKEYNANLRIKEFNSKSHFTDIKVQFVGLKGNKNTIALDLSPSEIIVDAPAESKIFNAYYQKSFSVLAYTLEEITAEKLRSLLQRTRVRDYYDLWHLLTQTKKLDRNKVATIFAKKIAYKKIKFEGKEQFFDIEKLAQAQAYYQAQVGNQLRHPPTFQKISEELKEAVGQLVLD
ncbi:nucleotidyl transferase AbiEii/AbiGii toxin family protein [Candidatus Micrarchaeota archaeon]|nr:nucleotidyl transferase AbiEii/AbiGii toxin family protein [Candidatus Micrarchaeota archaeon]